MRYSTKPHTRYRHDEHGDHESESIHSYADTLAGHVWAALVLRAMSAQGHDHQENRAYCRTLIKRALASSNTVQGRVNSNDTGLLSFTLWDGDSPEPVTFWVPWDQIRSDLSQAGHRLNI